MFFGVSGESVVTKVPAGVHWRALPEGMPMWGPGRDLLILILILLLRYMVFG